jgi:CBS domain-containing protein
MDTGSPDRLDSYPYRHTVDDIMSAPVVSMPASASAAEAAAMMVARSVSSVVVCDEAGRARGILTEKDVLRLAAASPQRLDRSLQETMTSPVHGIEAGALVYRAIARMARRGVRHLPVLDGAGHAVGMVSARDLLRQRAALALPLGDEIEDARDAATLASVHRRLPSLARGLRNDGVPPIQIAAVLASITRDLTARAADLALAAMRDAAEGEPPSPWCLLVLGSAGRGETLLVPDQDNALIHSGSSSDAQWFERFGGHINRVLDDAGVPYCKGGVMARNAAWRRSLQDWIDALDGWIARPRGEGLLDVDIFYDFVAVSGERALADALRGHATRAARASPMFLMMLAVGHVGGGAPLDLLGRFRTKDGRVDLKLHGLLPIVGSARAIALGVGSDAVATDARWQAAARSGACSADEAAGLVEARATIVEAILDQQMADIAAGVAPGSTVEPARLSRAGRDRLRGALRTAATAPILARDALAGRFPVGAS